MDLASYQTVYGGTLGEHVEPDCTVVDQLSFPGQTLTALRIPPVSSPQHNSADGDKDEDGEEHEVGWPERTRRMRKRARRELASLLRMSRTVCKPSPVKRLLPIPTCAIKNAHLHAGLSSVSEHHQTTHLFLKSKVWIKHVRDCEFARQ